MSKHIEVVSDESRVKDPETFGEMAGGLLTGFLLADTEREVTVRDERGQEATGRGDTSAEATANAVRGLR